MAALVEPASAGTYCFELEEASLTASKPIRAVGNPQIVAFSARSGGTSYSVETDTDAGPGTISSTSFAMRRRKPSGSLRTSK